MNTARCELSDRGHGSVPFQRLVTNEIVVPLVAKFVFDVLGFVYGCEFADFGFQRLTAMRSLGDILKVFSVG
jgi:hypothetical protein